MIAVREHVLWEWGEVEDMVTTTRAVQPSFDDDALVPHAYLRSLLGEATALAQREGLADVLTLVTAAVEDCALTPDVAFSLGQQLRLVIGAHPADGDLDAHLLLHALLSELIEVTSLVDGVHLDDLEPLVQHLVSVGDLAEAQRTTRLADATRARVRALESSIAADLGAV